MNKTLFFTSPDVPHFIEISNNLDEQRTLKLYFTGNNLNLFKLENVPCGNYSTLDSSYTFTLKELSSIYLEILPNCSDNDIDSFITGIVYDTTDLSVVQTYKLVLSLRSDVVSKNIHDFVALEKKYTSFQKNEIDTFQLRETNPLLTGNVKIQVDNNSEIYLSLFENISTNITTDLFDNRIVSNSNYPREISKFFQKIKNDHDIFYSKYTKDPGNKITMFPPHFQEINDVYRAGVRINTSKYRKEYYSAFAPLYIENKIPSKYVIFRKEKVSNIEPKDLLKDLTIVKSFDLSSESELGKFLANTISLDKFNNSHFTTHKNNNNLYLDVNGIELNAYSITTAFENIQQFLNQEQSQFSFEKYVTEIYKRKSIVSHKIFNLEFYFNDESADPHKFYSYFGVYLDDIDLESFDLDYSHNEYTNLFLDCSLDVAKEVNSLYTLSNNPLTSKYINNGDRLFYIKNQDSFYNLKSIIKNKEKNTFLLDNTINLCNVINQCKSINLQRENVIKYAKSFIKFNISEYSGISININKEYNIVIEDSDLGIDELKIYNQRQRKIKAELEYDTINDVEYVKIQNAYALHDLYPVEFFNEDDELLLSTICAYSFTNGNNTYLKFSDSINLDNVTYFQFEIPSLKTIKVSLVGIDSSQHLSTIVSKLNTLNLPYSFGYEADSFYVYSQKNSSFTASIDTKNNTNAEVKYFNTVVEPNRLTIENQDYFSNYIEYQSTIPTRKNEVLISIDSNIDGTYKYLLHGNVKDVPIISEIQQSVPLTTLTNAIKVDKDLVDRFIFKPCQMQLGIFSFYDVKEFDMNYFLVDDTYYLQEYNKMFKHYLENEPLIERMIYSVENTDITNPIQIKLEYCQGNNNNYKQLAIINVPQSNIVDFSTFISDYDIPLSKSKLTFKYRILTGNQNTVKVYNKFLYKDEELLNFFPEFPYTSFIDKTLLTKVQSDIDNRELGIYNYKEDSEYGRLQDLSVSTSRIHDVLNPTVLKWESSNLKNSLNQKTRLEFSPVFGRIGWNSTFSEYSSIHDLHSNEWFMLNSIPNELSILNGIERLYNFTDVDEDLLLNEEHDYFLEYFENGWPNVKRSSSSIPITTSENWSTLKRSVLNEYETSFKGVKYKFTSPEDLSNYKFTICNSTRPPIESSSALIEHCVVEQVDYNCKKDGILPQLYFELNKLIYTNVSKSLKISVINEDTRAYLPRVKSLMKAPVGSLFTSSDFYNEIKIAADLWKTSFNETYSTSNGMNSSLSLFINRETELFNYPVNTNYITPEDKVAYNIGDIRIGFADLGNSDIARTYFIRNSDVYEESVQTPVIILNSKVYFRKNSDTESTDAYSLAYVIAHELGHVFGLGHILNSGALMNPTVQQSYNLNSSHFNQVLKSCIKNVYGSYENLFKEPDVETYICTSSRNRKKDVSKFIVNKKFKTITLLMYNNNPSYLSFDSKKTYLDYYINKSPKRIVNVNGEYVLEGLDIEVPEIDLSSDSIKMLNSQLEVQNSYGVSIDSVNLGGNALNYSYRLSGNNRYYIDHYTLENSFSRYKLYRSYDASGLKNKALISTIKNSGNSVIESYLPLSTSATLKSSYFYKIRGGSSMASGNYKTTLDYLDKNKDSYSHLYSDDSSEKLFNFSIINLTQSQLNNLSTLEYSKYNSSMYYVNLISTNNTVDLFRYLGSFNPKVKKLMHFGLREDLSLSNLLNIDFYKLNTRFLHENPENFIYTENKRKMSFENIKGVENFEETMYSNFDDYKVDYIKTLKTTQNTFDLIYDVFIDTYDFKRISGFYDPYLFVNFHNSIGIKIDNTVSYKLTPDDLSYTIEQDRLLIDIDYEKVLFNIIKQMITIDYENIYNSNESNFEKSLERFILNTFKYFYNFKISMYSSKSLNTAYNQKITVKDDYYNIIDDTIKIEKRLEHPLEFSIDITLNRN